MTILLLLQSKSEGVTAQEEATHGSWIPQYEGLHPWQRKSERLKEIEEFVSKVEEEADEVEIAEQVETAKKEATQPEQDNTANLINYILEIEILLADLLADQQEEERARQLALQIIAAEQLLRRRYEDEVLFTLLFI